jgi:RTX calcium-binding nonapeptide repeat (4 copies)
MRRRWWVAAIGVAAAIGLTAAPASASVVTRTNTYPVGTEHSLIVSDSKGEDPGEVNDVKVGLAPEFPGDYRITDTAGIDDPLPERCVRESRTSIRCAIKVEIDVLGEVEVTRIFAKLGGANDEFSVLDPGGIPADVVLEVWGGPGDDTIWGRKGSGREELHGDSVGEFGEPVGPFGNDTLITGAPEDGKQLSGGGGDDVIVIIVNNQARSFFDATTPALTSKAITTSRILGETGNDRLTGGPSNDRMKGGPGRDRIKGRAGNDIIDCGPGKHDVGIGGPGRDLGRLCEKVKH